MFDWLIPIIASKASSVTDLANKVWAAINGLKNTLVDAFVHWVWGAIHLLQAVVHLGDGAVAFIISLARRLYLIMAVWLPQAVLQAISDAAAYANQLAGDVRNFVVAQFNQAVGLARQLVNDLSAWARAQVASIVDTVNKVVALLNDVARRVYSLLTDPRALADWIAGNIVQATFRWVVGNAESLARWGFSVAIRGAIGAASLLEQVIVDVFM